MPISRVHRPPIAIGGGIGAGKGAVASRLAELGATVINADEVGHDVIEPDGIAYGEVAGRWPSAVVDGRIDRRRLASIVFADADELSTLEAITHPAIIERIGLLVEESDDPVVVEIPVMLPMGEGWIHLFVDADEEVRVARATTRDGDEADVRRRVAAQADREEWLAWADEVIDNSGSVEELYPQVDAWWEQLLSH